MTVAERRGRDVPCRIPRRHGPLPHRLSLERIARAARDIDPVFRGSPQFEAEALGAALRARIIVKVETANPIRSFKGRGTDFLLGEMRPRPDRVVCASAGNFGQGMAWSARKRGIRCDIFASESANSLKVERMRAFGASVHTGGRDFDEAKELAGAHAQRHGLPFLEDGREPAIAEGAGSMAIELAQVVPAPDTLLVPLGNGALLAGVASWTRSAAPGTRIVGVCAAGAPAMERSWRAGRIIETERADTIADGIAVRVPVPEAVGDLDGLVDDIVLVGDESLRLAMRLVMDTLGLLVEPAGVAGVAALLEHGPALVAGTVGTPLCGGNVTAAQRREWGIV